MNKILKFKFQIHKFVNYIFYILIFILGFYIGYFSKNIKFNNFLSKIFMIENVHALEITTISNKTLDEDFISKEFSKIEGFDILEYSNIACSFKYYVNISSQSGLECYAFKNSDIDNLSISYNSYNKIYSLNYLQNMSFYYFNAVLNRNTGSYVNDYSTWEFSTTNYSSFPYKFLNTYTTGNDNTSNSSNKFYSNFIFNNHDSSISDNSFLDFNTKINKLVFTKYSYYDYDDSLFKDSKFNFSKMCWEFTDKTLFSITPNKELFEKINLKDYDNGEYTFRSGFYAYGNLTGFKRGTYSYKFIRMQEMNIFWRTFGREFEKLDNVTGDDYVFFDNDTIIKNWYLPHFAELDATSGYTHYKDNLDKLRYAKYYRFNYYFDSFDDRDYDIFKYEPDCETVGNPPGPGLKTTCYFQNEIKTYTYLPGEKPDFTSDICIYVPRDYNLSILRENSSGGITGIVETPQGFDEFTSSVSKNDEGFGNDFLDSFSFNSYGLVSVVQAPLVSIQKISSGTCTPVSFSFFGKDISFPCGDTIFWNREDIKPFKTFWNIFLGGIICYVLCISLFKDLRNIRDVDNDKIEVIDL